MKLGTHRTVLNPELAFHWFIDVVQSAYVGMDTRVIGRKTNECCSNLQFLKQLLVEKQ